MKKFLFIFVVFVLVIGISVQVTKAFSMTETLNTLSNILNQLKDKLTAKVTLPYSHYGIQPIVITPSMVSCTSDSNCEVVELMTDILSCCCGRTDSQRT
jgi:hypothetical protein